MSLINIAQKLFPISFLSIVLVLVYQQKNELYEILKAIDSNWFLAGLMFYFFNYLTRAWRLQLLAEGGQIPFIVALKTSSLHGYYSYFLPFRSGDISLPLLLKQFTSLPLTIGSSILLRARLLDMFSLGILLLCSIILTIDKLAPKVIFLFCLITAILLGAPIFIRQIILKSRRIKKVWFKLFAKDVVQHPMSLRDSSLSMLIWFWTGCTLFSATQAISIPIDFLDIWFLVAIQLPLQLLPIQGIANSGNHEIGWVTGLVLLGNTAEEGLKFALASHSILILYVITLGAIGFLLPKKRSHSSIRE